MHLLTSLPEPFNILVTALEANPEVPKMETITECLLHEEWKAKDREDHRSTKLEAMTAQGQKRKFTCQKQNCQKLAANKEKRGKPGTREKGDHKGRPQSEQSCNWERGRR